MTTMIDKLTVIAKVKIAERDPIMGGPGMKEEFQARRVVRGLLVALLEPSEVMLEAGLDAIQEAAQFGKMAAMPNIWSAMIQAALDEG